MEQKQSRQPSREQLADLWDRGVKSLASQWELGEVVELRKWASSHPSYKLLLKYLSPLVRTVGTEVWKRGLDAPSTEFLRGQHSVLERLLSIELEMERMEEAMEEEIRREKEMNRRNDTTKSSS